MNKVIYILSVLMLLFVIGGGMVFLGFGISETFVHKSVEDKREEFVMEKDIIIAERMAMGDYTCCLEKPCTYCIEKTPGHGIGSACTCLQDIVEGRHPCGECIGEILEGHGNKYLKEYFPQAIAEEVGEEHLVTLQVIIDQKYPGDEVEEGGFVCDRIQEESVCGE